MRKPVTFQLRTGADGRLVDTSRNDLDAFLLGLRDAQHLVLHFHGGRGKPARLLRAQTLDRRDRVHIFQSEEFRGMIPEEAQRFENLHWTPKGADRGASLVIMRQTMIGFRGSTAGVFIGGMDDVEREFEIFQQSRPEAPAFPVASTGGAALKLWKASQDTLAPRQRERLRYDVTYRSLFRDLLGV